LVVVPRTEPNATVAGTDLVQALRHLGKEAVGSREISMLRAALSQAEKRKLVKDTRFGVDWIYEVAKRIAEKAA
jgi:hypothetical protein